MKQDEVVVSICSLAFNHAPYISQCLDGILMQKCDFKYEVIVNDDCSTDGTTQIIQKYAEKFPDIIKPIYHNENQYSKGIDVFTNCVSKAKGKYIALCEGDDYWTDPLKLQKQVSYLEQHPSCVVCTHAFYKLINNNLVKWSSRLDHNFKYTHADFFKSWITQPLSAVIRSSALPLQSEVQDYKYYQDTHLFYLLLRKGSGYNIGEYMGVYRITGNGVFTSLIKNNVILMDISCYQELYDKYKNDNRLRNKLLNLLAYYSIFSKNEKITPSVPSYRFSYIELWMYNFYCLKYKLNLLICNLLRKSSKKL